MSRSSNDSAYGSWGRRKSGLFALSALSHVGSNDAESKSPRMLKKHRKRPSLHMPIDHPDISREHDEIANKPSTHESAKLRRASLSMKGSLKRPPSMFGSLRNSTRSSSDPADDGNGEPLSATSTSTMSIGDHAMETASRRGTVLLHGEVQTSAGMFRKKKEYLVLTDTAITRFKSQAKASEVYSAVPNPLRPSPSPRHTQVPSLGSASDLQTLSDSSGDKDGRIPLQQVVAMHRLDDGKPYFANEICFLDEESAQSSSMTLQFGNPEERNIWLKSVRSAVAEARTQNPSYISNYNLETAARIIERENDYDPANCAIYKVVHRQSAGKAIGKSGSTDDLTKQSSTVSLLAIGVHKVHIIQLARPVTRSSSPSLTINTTQGSYGLLSLTGVKVSFSDDTFELIFRQPLQSPRRLYLTSSASHEIAARLHYAENLLRPEFGSRMLKFDVPEEVENMLSPQASADEEEHSCFHRTLTAYCVAYGVNPANVRYTINYHCEDAPRFELLPPADKRRPQYGPLDCLAVMRALRYNETFVSISFENIPLDCLNGLHDNYGFEHVCSATKSDTPIKLSPEELRKSCLLVQEVRALAATSKKLRRLDFSGCIKNKPPPTTTEIMEDDATKPKDNGCGIVEALFPLCRHQTTNVDWICLNRIYLSETDLDYLVGAAVEKQCHFRAIELNRCGLTDRTLGLILDALRAQDNTLEAIEIAGNTARLNPATFDSQLGMFGFIRKLNLSYVSQTSGHEPLLTAETLLIWRLSELRLSGTVLNQATIDAVATYLAHPQSDSLHGLYVDDAYLSGSDIAALLHSMMRGSSMHRDMHFDFSQNLITRNLHHVTRAISSGMTPSHMSMRTIEYRDEAAFRKMLAALTVNSTIQYLDMSHTALPGDASEETCRALEKLLAENKSIIEFNLNGEDSRLATSRIGPGINDALAGLKRNKTMQTFHIEKQRLGLQGSSTLAEVLKENDTLRELYCDNNEIPLQGLTDLVNSLADNKSIIHLPAMQDGRAAAFRSAEQTMKAMSTVEPPPPSRSPSFATNSSFAMKRGFASVRRTASAYTPNLPASSNNRNSPSTGSPLSLSFSGPSFSKTRQASSVGPTAASSPTTFTIQDVQSTHRLLSEQWDRQCARLAQLLDRNWCILHDMAPSPSDLPDDESPSARPDSVGSLGKMLAQVKYDTTPRAERPFYFDEDSVAPDSLPAEAGALEAWKAYDDEQSHRQQVDSVLEEHERGFGFKQFILESGPSSRNEDVDADGLTREFKLDPRFESPATPTAPEFPS